MKHLICLLVSFFLFACGSADIEGIYGDGEPDGEPTASSGGAPGDAGTHDAAPASGGTQGDSGGDASGGQDSGAPAAGGAPQGTGGTVTTGGVASTGGAAPSECSSGATRCEGTQTQVCNDSGNWGIPETCGGCPGTWVSCCYQNTCACVRDHSLCD